MFINICQTIELAFFKLHLIVPCFKQMNKLFSILVKHQRLPTREQYSLLAMKVNMFTS